MSKTDLALNPLTPDELLAVDGPTCLIIKAKLEPLGQQNRFQPAGFPEIGHVIYDAPSADASQNSAKAKVCIVDSAASMANHLESLCFENATTGIIHHDLAGLPYVRCVTGPDKNVLVLTSISEGHRLASDYFLDAEVGGQNFRGLLRKEFGIVEIKKNETYFVTPESWWKIYKTIFKYDPNSLVHGILFAKEQIKISRLLTAHLEAFGAARVGSAGVKFDRLGKTTSGQPIFSKDEETAERIEATFMIDLGLLRSYGYKDCGLSLTQKRLLLELAFWKVQRMLAAPFRFRSGCHLQCVKSQFSTESGPAHFDAKAFGLNVTAAIKACSFGSNPVTDAYYTESKLYKAEAENAQTQTATPDDANDEGDN